MRPSQFLGLRVAQSRIYTAAQALGGGNFP
jgi:hypothetical protein